MKKIAIISSAVLVLLAFSFLGVVQVGLPQSAPALSAGPNLTLDCASTHPCPMGIADYGDNGASTYHYTAVEFKSWVNFTALNIGTGIHQPNHQMTIQQNTIDYSVYENGHAGEYWIQDVPQINQNGNSYKIFAEDNIWNFSSSNAVLGGKIYGNGESDCSSYAQEHDFYYCYSKQTFTTTLPFEVELVVLTGKDPSGSHASASVVQFEYGVYHAGVSLGFYAYDWVDFSGVAPAYPAFHVGGFNPGGYWNDAATILGGDSSSSVKIVSISATFSEFYAPSSYNSYVPIPHAYSDGHDTAETVYGVHMTGSASNHEAIASSGADNGVQLF
jgi:hypothetical protein